MQNLKFVDLVQGEHCRIFWLIAGDG